MPIYNRLVRDRTISLLDYSDGLFSYSTLSEEEFAKALKDKLRTEVEAYLASDDEEELVEILEVVLTLAKTHGMSELDLADKRLLKREERGGFELRYVLQELNRETDELKK